MKQNKDKIDEYFLLSRQKINFKQVYNTLDKNELIFIIDFIINHAIELETQWILEELTKKYIDKT